MKKTMLFLILLLSCISIYSQDLRISQIDSNALMLRGEAGIYFSIPGADPDRLNIEDFTVSEETAGGLEITGFEKRPNEKNPVSFILLIDNSGSMYEELAGGKRRIDRAMAALEAFLDQIEASRDIAAVYTFNTMLEEIAPPGTTIADIRRSLPSIRRPEAEQAYTELYNSLNEAASFFPKTAGRRAVIVLSDGENYPAAARIAAPDEIIRTYHESGVSLDGISIADTKDAALAGICSESGGVFYDVRSAAEIASVYAEIKEKIRSEFMLSVKLPPLQNNVGMIKIGWNGKTDSSPILLPVLFGGTAPIPAATSLVILLLAAVCIVLLFLIPVEKPAAAAQIQSLDTNQKTVLNTESTVIGASRDADFTLAGSPGIDPEHATILRDGKGGFTIVSRKPLRVNNRRVKSRKLTPGDVIRIEGSTIIFDEPPEKGGNDK